MTPGARLAAAIEILTDIGARRRPAPDTLKDWGLSHRFAGSGDRAGIAGLVYDALRRRASSAYLMGEDTPRATLLGMLDAGNSITFLPRSMAQANARTTRATLRVTDLQCDARGRVWATAANPGSAAADGKLFMFDAGRGRATVASRLLTPSGLAWSVDGTTLYLAESGRAVVHVYDFDLDNGGLGQPHTFADLGAMPGDLGGLTVDGDDHLWVALPGASCLVRYVPTGRVDRVVRMLVTLPTAYAFGGDHGERMFVTTARDGSVAGERRAEALAGRTLVFDAGVAGRPPHRARMP